MNTDIDYAAFELGLARPRLRGDLAFSYRQSKHGQYYLIEDELNSKFYRVGIAEYTFLSLLDGHTTVQSAVAATAAKLGVEAFTEAEAANICKWLIDCDLAAKKRHDAVQWRESQQQRRFAEQLQWVNPIMLKVPLGNPDRLMATLTQLTGWLVNVYVGAIVVILLAISTALVLAHSSELFTHRTIFTRNNWIWLAVSWLTLRVLHESAHAVVCKRFGGRVREWGVLLLMFIPLPYVDVTSAWRFPSRPKRILTSAAGMIVELSIAGLATIAWCYSDSPLVKQHALNIMLAGSITTLLFNANPLMRFDGYHILADFLEMPNLWTHGRQFIRSVGRRLFFGLPSSTPPWRASQATLVRTYGIAAALWKVGITASLTLAALALLDGIGLVLALIALALWIGLPTYRILRFLAVGTQTEQPSRKQFALALTTCLASVLAAGHWLPAPTVVTAPIVIEHDPLHVVRCKTAGFFVELTATTGDAVRKGDVLCRMENAELAAQHREVSLQLAESKQRLRTYQSTGEAAAYQIELAATRNLQTKLQELDRMIDDLIITAPCDGTVIDSASTDRLGTYLETGCEIAKVGSPNIMKAVGLMPQDDWDFLETGMKASVRIWGTRNGTTAGLVKQVRPRAQTSLPHFSFAAPLGGDRAVVETSTGKRGEDPGTDWELTKPHMAIEIQLNDPPYRLLAGQTGVASIRTASGQLGPYVVQHLRQFLRDKIVRNHGI